MTELDQRIHEDLERLVAAAPLPPSVHEIAARRPVVDRNRRPLLTIAAVVLVLAAIAGAIALRSASDDGDGSPVAEGFGPVAEDPDLLVLMNENVTAAQVEALRLTIEADPTVVEVAYADEAATVAGLGGDEAVVFTSFRVDIIGHELRTAAVASLIHRVNQSPGVRDVVVDPIVPLDRALFTGGTGQLPHLVPPDAGWWLDFDTSVPLDTIDAFEGSLVVYAEADGRLPIVIVETRPRAGVDPTDEEVVDVNGHDAIFRDDRAGTRTVFWTVDRLDVVVSGRGIPEDEALAIARSVEVGDDGLYAASEPPAGMSEVYRSGPLPPSPTLSWTFHRRDGGLVAFEATVDPSDHWMSLLYDVSWPDATESTIRGRPAVIEQPRDVPGVINVSWMQEDGVAMHAYLDGVDAPDVPALLSSFDELDEASWQNLMGSRLRWADPPPYPDWLDVLYPSDDRYLGCDLVCPGEVPDVPAMTTIPVVVSDDCASTLPTTPPDPCGDSAPTIDPAPRAPCIEMDDDGDGTEDDCLRIYTGPAA